MTSNRFSSRRRGGFLTLGLILCVILALTVAGVLWNYQYLTIQSVEMECAARSAIQAAINDPATETSMVKVLETSEGAIVSGTTLNTVLEATYAQQNSNDAPTVRMYNKSEQILSFTQNHKLGVFSGTIEESKRTTIEGKTFTQYYKIYGSSSPYTFNKCAN